ncbi:hypothetical protein [Flavobacterium chungangensis]|uniref:Uncharacterized protein n=1 Tax=Flavobacterium chungangensis TaxID=2708132 RepID=A0ABV8ZEI6_9FLAO
MSNYASVVNYIRDTFKSDKLVNEVIFGPLDDRNLASNNIYPLVHITPLNTSYSSGDDTFNFISFSFEIAVIEIRQKGIQFGKDEFYKDNLIDNLNLANQIMVNALSVIRSDYNQDEIFFESVTDAQPIIFQDTQLLDGWMIDLTLNIPNNYTRC